MCESERGRVLREIYREGCVCEREREREREIRRKIELEL